MKKSLFWRMTLLLLGFVLLQDVFGQLGNREKAIQNAILDFSSIKKMYSKDSVFSVSFHDTICRMVLEKSDDGRGYEWTCGEIIEGIITVGISASTYQFLLNANVKIGGKGKLPSRFIEKDGKLFYWWDDDYPLTESTLMVLKKYQLLQNDESGLLTIPINKIDETAKGVHYYFCRNNIAKYKKIITNRGLGYYDPPKLKCDD